MRRSDVLNVVFFLGLVFSVHGQENYIVQDQKDEIEGLVIYPNPVSNGKLYISTSQNAAKRIEIFDVLGKRVKAASIRTKELDISRLLPGLYVLKITENSKSVTRKLIVR